MNIKKLVGAVCLASLGVGGLAASASAVQCTSLFSTSWTASARCAAPNNLKGRSVGLGTVGALTQRLTAHLDQATAGGSSDRASASGFNAAGSVVVGQFASCAKSDSNPNFNVGQSTVGGDCRDPNTGVAAIKHRVIQTF